MTKSITTDPGVQLLIQGRLEIGESTSILTPAATCDGIASVNVAGEGVGSNQQAVTIASSSSVWANIYAHPDQGDITFDNGADIHGTFWGHKITGGSDMQIEYCPPTRCDEERGPQAPPVAGSAPRPRHLHQQLGSGLVGAVDGVRSPGVAFFVSGRLNP